MESILERTVQNTPPGEDQIRGVIRLNEEDRKQINAKYGGIPIIEAAVYLGYCEVVPDV